MYFPCFCILEMKYMTLLQRDRENIELGREEGREEGRNRMASLTKILLSKNRTEELNRALEDPDFRNRLFEEYIYHKICLHGLLFLNLFHIDR